MCRGTRVGADDIWSSGDCVVREIEKRISAIEEVVRPTHKWKHRPWLILETDDGVNFRDDGKLYTEADFAQLERDRQLIFVRPPGDKTSDYDFSRLKNAERIARAWPILLKALQREQIDNVETGP